MAATFGEKFEQALAAKRKKTPAYGLRTLARALADGDPRQTEIVRRRLNKYRPKPGGGAAEVRPTEPTRREIEKAMGLKRDALKADPDAIAATAVDEFLLAVAPFRELTRLADRIESELVRP